MAMTGLRFGEFGMRTVWGQGRKPFCLEVGCFKGGCRTQGLCRDSVWDAELSLQWGFRVGALLEATAANPSGYLLFPRACGQSHGGLGTVGKTAKNHLILGIGIVYGRRFTGNLEFISLMFAVGGGQGTLELPRDKALGSPEDIGDAT